jgi:hypothetical protein
VIGISRYCIPWTPFGRPLEEAVVMLVSSAAVHHKDQPPFALDGDLGFRAIATAELSAAELRVADAHYPHDCVDVDLNSIFPVDRLHELAHHERRIRAVAELHFSTGFTAELRRFRDETVPAITDQIVKVRPDCVVLTGG